MAVAGCLCSVCCPPRICYGCARYIAYCCCLPKDIWPSHAEVRAFQHAQAKWSRHYTAFGGRFNDRHRVYAGIDPAYAAGWITAPPIDANTLYHQYITLFGDMFTTKKETPTMESRATLTIDHVTVRLNAQEVTEAAAQLGISTTLLKPLRRCDIIPGEYFQYTGGQHTGKPLLAVATAHGVDLYSDVCGNGQCYLGRQSGAWPVTRCTSFAS